MKTKILGLPTAKASLPVATTNHPPQPNLHSMGVLRRLQSFLPQVHQSSKVLTKTLKTSPELNTTHEMRSKNAKKSMHSFSNPSLACPTEDLEDPWGGQNAGHLRVKTSLPASQANCFGVPLLFWGHCFGALSSSHILPTSP